MNMKVSDAAIARLMKIEGFEPKAYKDGFDAKGRQLYSIAYGHQISLAEPKLLTSTLSKSQGVAIMHSDIHPLELQLNQTLKVVPTVNQFDVLALFGYNTGSDALRKVIDTWNATHDSHAVTAQLLLYNKKHKTATELVVDPDLVKRRNDDVAIFNSKSSPIAAKALPVVAIAALVGCFLLLRS